MKGHQGSFESHAVNVHTYIDLVDIKMADAKMSFDPPVSLLT